jgi:hypothetical protein
MVDFLTTEQMAALIGVSPDTVRGWRLADWGPRFYRPCRGKHTPAMYRRQDVLAWLETRASDAMPISTGGGAQ